MAGISEDERLRLEEERLSKTMIARASGKKQTFVAKPAEAKQAAAPKAAVVAKPAAQTRIVTQATPATKEEDRLAAAVSRQGATAAQPAPKFKGKELSEEEKNRIKAHEALMRKREEEAAATAELERKHAERRAADEAERKNRSYNSYFYGTEIKPFRSGDNSQVPEPSMQSQPPKDLAKAPLQDFTATLMALTHGGAVPASSPAPQAAPKVVEAAAVEQPKHVVASAVVQEKPKAAVLASASAPSSGNVCGNPEDELPSQSRSMKNLYKAFTGGAAPADRTPAPTPVPVYTAPPVAVAKPVVEEPAPFLPPPSMAPPPPPPAPAEEPAPFVYNDKRASSQKSRAHADLDDIDALISGIDKSVAESAADVARKENESRQREAERQQREAREQQARREEEERRRVEVERKVEEQRVQLETQRKEREALEEAKKQRAREEEERRMQAAAEYDRQQAAREEEMQERVKAARIFGDVNLSLDNSAAPTKAAPVEEQPDPSVAERQLALQSVQASVTKLRMNDYMSQSETSALLTTLPATSQALTDALLPFLQPNALQAIRGNVINWKTIAAQVARVTEAAHHASAVAPQQAETLVSLADELLTQTSSLIATSGAWLHTGGDGSHVQDNAKALLATLLQLIRTTKATLTADAQQQAPAPTPSLQVAVASPARPKTPSMQTDRVAIGHQPQLQPPQPSSPFVDEEIEEPGSTVEYVNNIAASGKRLLALVNSFSDGADIGSTIAAFVDALQAVQTNVSEVAVVFNADDGKALIELTKALMQHGLDFVRVVRTHSTQGTPLDFDAASAQVRSQLIELLRTLNVADKTHRAQPATSLPVVSVHPAVGELNAHGKRLQMLLDEPELDGDGFIAEMKLLVNVARSRQAGMPDGDAKDRIGLAAKTLLQRGIAYRTAQSPGAKDAVLDAFGELSAAVAAA